MKSMLIPFHIRAHGTRCRLRAKGFASAWSSSIPAFVLEGVDASLWTVYVLMRGARASQSLG